MAVCIAVCINEKRWKMGKYFSQEELLSNYLFINVLQNLLFRVLKA